EESRDSGGFGGGLEGAIAFTKEYLESRGVGHDEIRLAVAVKVARRQGNKLDPVVKGDVDGRLEGAVALAQGHGDGRVIPGQPPIARNTGRTFVGLGDVRSAVTIEVAHHQGNGLKVPSWLAGGHLKKPIAITQ